MARIFLTVDLGVSVTRLLSDIRTVHLAVVLVVIGHDATQPGVPEIGVQDWAIEGGVVSAFTLITPVELWAVPSVVSGVGDLTIEAFESAGGVRCRRRGHCTDMGLSAV